MNYVTVGRTSAFSMQSSEWKSLRRPRWRLGETRPACAHGRLAPEPQPQGKAIAPTPADELADLDPERWDGLA